MTATLSLAGYTEEKELEVVVQPAPEAASEEALASYPFENAWDYLQDASGENDLTSEETAGVYRNDGLMGSGAVDLTSNALTLPAELLNVEDFSIVLWAQMTGTTTNRNLLTLTGENGETLALTLKNGSGKIQYQISDGNQSNQLVSEDMIGYGEWAQVAITQKGNTVTLWLNGQPVGTDSTFALYPVDVAGTAAQLGMAPVLLDDLAIYNRALTEEELLEDYAAKTEGTAVAFGQAVLYLEQGTTRQAAATLVSYPNQVVSGGEIRYSVKEGTAVTVTEDGLLTAVEAGTALVEAAIDGASDLLQVVVSEDEIPATEVVGLDTMSAKVGQTLDLAVSIAPAESTDTLTYAIEDETVATISDTGVLQALKVGETVITVTAREGVSLEITLTVTDPLLVRYEFDGNMDDSSTYEREIRSANGTYEYISGHSPEIDDESISLTTVATGVGHAIRLQDAILSANPATFTISVWVKPSALTAHSAVFFAQGSNRWMSIVPCSVDTGTPTVRICNDGTSKWSDITAPDPLPLNEWSLLTYTFDNGTVRLYVDGEEAAMRNEADNPLNARGWRSNTFYIGSNLWDPSFQGGIDDFRIYDIALSAEEISALYQETWEDNPFTDVEQGLWYYDAIHYVEVRELMDGMSETTFVPNGTLTRAQVAQILYNKEGKPATEAENPFTDVEEGLWYYDAIRWAAEAGVVNGTSPDKFTPQKAITREQLAVMLYRYAAYKELDTSAENDLTAFTDVEQISEWAKDAMVWSVGAGIIGGKGDRLDPLGGATRAEAATMIMRFCENVK